MKELNIAALGQAMDTTWGRSSTPQTASHSVKFSFMGDKMILAHYRVIINLVAEKDMILTKRECNEESEKYIAGKVKALKNTYKELTGDTLKTKEVNSTDSLEIINFNVHNPKRTAYFHKKVVFEIA